MDSAQLERHRFQQVDSVHQGVQYAAATPQSLLPPANSNCAEFPIFLTTWHLIFATIMTQGLARFTSVLDSRHTVPITGQVYLRAIVPIGIFFSLSLICGNQTYLYLSVAFIQMLKVCVPREMDEGLS